MKKTPCDIYYTYPTLYNHSETRVKRQTKTALLGFTSQPNGQANLEDGLQQLRDEFTPGGQAAVRRGHFFVGQSRCI